MVVDQVNRMDAKFSGFDVAVEQKLAKFVDSIRENSTICNQNSDFARTSVTAINERLGELDKWRELEVETKFQQIDETFLKFRDDLSDIFLKLTVLDERKVPRNEFDAFVKETQQDLYNKEIRVDSIKSNLLTLEHYCERYIPMKIQSMLIENMKVIHGQEMIDLLTSEENKLFKRLQHEILDETNFTAGTIFEEIKLINLQMSKQL